MGRGNLSEEEIQILLQNPYVQKAKGNCIIFTDEFKLHFMEEYNAGKGPNRIFREAGFDVKILGTKRIERAAARWKEAYASNSLIKPSDGEAPKRTRGKNVSRQIESLEQEIEWLKKQISILYAKSNIENTTN